MTLGFTVTKYDNYEKTNNYTNYLDSINNIKY